MEYIILISHGWWFTSPTNWFDKLPQGYHLASDERLHWWVHLYAVSVHSWLNVWFGWYPVISRKPSFVDGEIWSFLDLWILWHVGNHQRLMPPSRWWHPYSTVSSIPNPTRIRPKMAQRHECFNVHGLIIITDHHRQHNYCLSEDLHCSGLVILVMITNVRGRCRFDLIWVNW